MTTGGFARGLGVELGRSGLLSKEAEETFRDLPGHLSNVDVLKRVLAATGIGAGVGGLAGYALPPDEEEDETRGGNALQGALAGGTGGLLGSGVYSLGRHAGYDIGANDVSNHFLQAHEAVRRKNIGSEGL